MLAPSRLAPVVALQAWVGVGAADEPARRAGIAHMFEHMLFKGTARRGVGEIAQSVESAGGEINAWTSFDQTVYHVILGRRHFDTGLDVLADALQRSSFDPGEIEREREVILEEIRQSQDDPGRTVVQSLFSTAFRRHPYRRPVIGDADTVRAMSRSDLLAFFRGRYTADNIALVIAGDFDVSDARRGVAAQFADMRTGGSRPARTTEPRQRDARGVVHTRDIGESFVSLGYHIPRLRDPDTAALDVAAIVLGQGDSSRLSATLRRGRELVTSATAYAHTLRDPGLFVINATTRPEDTRDAVEALAEQIGALAERGITDDELAKAKHAVWADTVFQHETAQGMARKYGYYHSVAGDARFEDAYVDRVRALTADDVRATCAKHLSCDNATVSALMPPARSRAAERGRAAEAGRLMRRLGKGAERAARPKRRARAVQRAAPTVIREVLPNGVRVIVKRDPSVPVVAMRAVWLGGLRRETPATNGVTHLLASTLTRGCGVYTAEELITRIDDMAGSLAGFAGRNSFGVRAEWLAADWAEGFDLLATCVLSPRLDPVEIKREKRRVRDELVSRADVPAVLAFRRFAETLYRKHPYRMDILGTPTSIESVDAAQLARHYAAAYPVSGMTLAIVGDVDPNAVLARARARFGDRPAQPAKARNAPQEVFTGRAARSREVFQYLARNQAHLVIGFPGLTLDDPDRYVLEVLVTILGGQGGRLFVELRDRQALAYRVNAFSVEGIDPGYIAVYLACQPEKLDAAVTGIRAELTELVDRPVSRDELERAKRYLVGTHDISLQRRAAQASALAFHEAYGLGYASYLRYNARIRAVTAADVQRVARTYFDWSVAVTATVMPPTATPAAARRANGVRRRIPRGARSKPRRRREP